MDKLLLIDDEADVQYSFRRIFDSPDIQLTTAASGEEGLKLIPQVKPDLVIMDVRMAGMTGLETLRRLRQSDAKLPVIIMTAYGTTQTAIEAMKLGAYDYLLKPFDIPRMKQLITEALKVSRDMSTLVSYQHSRRSGRSFLAINCAAIPEQLLESELFGHEKGAFTGATATRIGKFQQANFGTILLDEIGEMKPPLQAKLLHVLQDAEFTKLGSNKKINIDVRVLAATNRDLEKMMLRGEFREDLYYRLKVIEAYVPPLRERRDEIPHLTDFFIAKYSQRYNRPVRPLSTDLRQMFLTYEWPGNVRELENMIKRFVILQDESLVTRELMKPRPAPGPSAGSMYSGMNL